MKPINFLPIVMIAAAGLVASCSTTKLAQTSTSDDVYNTVAKAREVEAYVPPQNQVQAQEQNDYGDEYYGTSNPYYDMDYSSRINRFHNGSNFRGYYDPYYENFAYGNSYGATNYLGYGVGGWNNGYGMNFGLGWGGGYGWGGSIWNNPFYYGNMGFGWNNWGWNNWGPYSYYDRFGWGGGGYGGGWGIGGGYYGGGIYTNNNYRPRPGSNDRGVPRSYGNGNAGNAGRPSRSGVAGPNGPTRQGYAPNYNAGRPTRNQQSGSNGAAPGRYTPQGTQGSRPTRNESYSPPQRTEMSRPSYSPPPSSGGSSGGGSNGGGGGGSRPSRAGRG